MAQAREAAIHLHEPGNGRQRSAKAAREALAPSLLGALAGQLASIATRLQKTKCKAFALALAKLLLLRSCACAVPSYKKGRPTHCAGGLKRSAGGLKRYDSRRKRALFLHDDFIELIAISFGVLYRNCIQKFTCRREVSGANAYK